MRGQLRRVLEFEQKATSTISTRFRSSTKAINRPPHTWDKRLKKASRIVLTPLCNRRTLTSNAGGHRQPELRMPGQRDGNLARMQGWDYPSTKDLAQILWIQYQNDLPQYWRNISCYFWKTSLPWLKCSISPWEIWGGGMNMEMKITSNLAIKSLDCF